MAGKRSLLVTVLAAIIAMGLSATGAQAGKGGGGSGGGGKPGPSEGPAPSGIVYFESAGTVYELDVETGSYQAVPVDSAGVRGLPGRQPHGGLRWFIGVEEMARGVFPDNGSQLEVFAYSENGMRVQLTNHASNLQVWGMPRWSGDGTDFDAAASWAAIEWADLQGEDGVLDTAVAAGIYRADLEWGSDGEIVGITAMPSSPDIGLDFGSGSGVDLYGYDWSPDGTSAVYSDGQMALWRVDDVDVAPGAPRFTHTALGLQGHTVWWSPDGTKLLSGYDGDVWTANPDGSARTVILKGETRISRQRTFRFHYPRGWPSDSSHALVDTLTGCFYGTPCTRPLSRMRADGSDFTEMVPDGFGLGWVD